MRRVEAGEPGAVEELLQGYGQHVMRAVRRHLRSEMRSKFDSDDFVQDVWKSFFAAPPAADKFLEPRHLAGYLVAMARNKIGQEQRRRLKTLKFDVRRERSLDDCLGAGQSEPIDDHPTPSQVVSAREQWQQLVAEGCTDRVREILRLRCLGMTFDEIGRNLGIHARTARRAIEKLAREERA